MSMSRSSDMENIKSLSASSDSDATSHGDVRPPMHMIVQADASVFIRGARKGGWKIQCSATLWEV